MGSGTLRVIENQIPNQNKESQIKGIRRRKILSYTYNEVNSDVSGTFWRRIRKRAGKTDEAWVD